MLDTFESPQDGQDAGDTRMWDAMKEGDATAGPTGSEDPEDEIVDDDLQMTMTMTTSTSLASTTRMKTTMTIWTTTRTISTTTMTTTIWMTISTTIS